MDNPAIWTFATIGGPIVLILIIAYALMRRKRLTPNERSAQIKGTERGYDEPENKP